MEAITSIPVRQTKVSMARSPIRVEQWGEQRRDPPPALGEHGEAVLREVLQLSEAELARLIAGRPSPPETSPPNGSRDVLVGDPSKLREKTGWEPRVPLTTSVQDLLTEE